VLYHNAAEEEKRGFSSSCLWGIAERTRGRHPQALRGVAVFLAVGNKPSLSETRPFADLRFRLRCGRMELKGA